MIYLVTWACHTCRKQIVETGETYAIRYHTACMAPLVLVKIEEFSPLTAKWSPIYEVNLAGE